MMDEKKLVFDVGGMTCASCAHHVEQALMQVDGVGEVSVPGWESGQAIVRAKSGIDPADLTAAAAQAGYQAALRSTGDRTHTAVPFFRKGDPGDHYHLVVIGGGSAGFAAAIKGAELGYNVALIESGTIGGTCVNTGCIPSKTLIRATGHYHGAGHSPFRGVQTSAGALDWRQVVAQKDELVAEMRQSKYTDVLRGYPTITYLHGRARLTGGNGVEVEGQRFTPNRIILATGASPWSPPIPGLAEAGYLTSTTAMELGELPPSLIVLGASAVGLELAQTFARAGTRVTLLELLPRIAPFEEEAISTALQDYLEAEGLRVVTGFQT